MTPDPKRMQELPMDKAKVVEVVGLAADLFCAQGDIEEEILMRTLARRIEEGEEQMDVLNGRETPVLVVDWSPIGEDKG